MPADWTKGTGWPGCNVKCKALRSCGSCSEKRKTELETGMCRHWNHSCGGSEIHPLGESQKMRLLNQEMAKTSPDYLVLGASVWQVSMNRKPQQELLEIHGTETSKISFKLSWWQWSKWQKGLRRKKTPRGILKVFCNIVASLPSWKVWSEEDRLCTEKDLFSTTSSWTAVQLQLTQLCWNQTP